MGSRYFRRDAQPVDPAVAVAAGDYASAIAIYRRWLTEDPERAITWNRKLGEVLALAGRKREAVTAYLVAAAGLVRENRMVQALALYRVVMRLDPDNEELRAKLGEIAAESDPTAGLNIPAGASPASMTIRTRLRKFVPLFSNFERDELTKIVEVMAPRDVRAGETVFRQGDKGDSIFIVVQGEVSLSVRGRDGQPVELDRVADGGFFGEVSALRRIPRNVTAICVRDSELLELMRDYLEAVAIAHPRVWKVLEEFQHNRQTPVGV
jgi:cAMP-dependent protein kinase regulator